MNIHTLESIQYPTPPREPNTNRFGPQSIFVPFPTESDLVAAVRRLDRIEWPYVWLHTSDPPEDEFPENMLEVMGGRNEFAITLYTNGDEIAFVDESRRGDDKFIEIWESDQGRNGVPWALCNDIEVVLDIILYFHQYGELSPEYAWKSS